LLRIASKWHALKVAIVIDTPEQLCIERNLQRPNRQFGPHVIRNQRNEMRRFFSSMKSERWHKVYTIRPEDIDSIEVVREPSWSRKPNEHGPFDIIGDVHGCLDELHAIITKLGWETTPALHHPDGRKLFFVGDLVDRGPDSVGVLKFVMDAVASGVALCVPGNHDVKLVKALKGQAVTRSHGLQATMEQLDAQPKEFRDQVREFLYTLVSHQVVDDGKLCVAHAGLRAEMQGRGSSAVREFCLYGETTGEIDEFGLPVRYEWARDYLGKTLVVYGHTPVPEAEFLNNTIDIDTGCCFGGKLTALRYPEKELVSVPAARVYSEPVRPIDFERGIRAQPTDDGVLDIDEVLGRRTIETALDGRITIREENAIAALEVMSRFAADPRWLIYLPPTMSPCQTSMRDGYLEHPAEALQYYRDSRVSQVVCEEKHMGSRAVAVVCRNPDVARTRFDVDTGEIGIITTRTGRRFFTDAATESELLARLRSAAEQAGVLEELRSDWLLIDLELMPWSAKAIGLLQAQYAPVGNAAAGAARALLEVATGLTGRGIEGAEAIFDSATQKLNSAVRFQNAYRHYCWTVNSIDDYKLAPFHLLASEGAVHTDKDHVWHMETLGRICDEDPAILRRTPYRVVELGDEQACSDAIDWWETLTRAGGEGMVVKPLKFIELDRNRPVQPAVKCRGSEYLRIIYGPEYLDPVNLERLRKRGLNRKRSLASREFALGIEGLTRFVHRESLRRVHECVFGVLALESEPVDPRL
jgi:protein phosphatase